MKKIIFLLAFPFILSAQTTEVKSNKDSIPQKTSSTSRTKEEAKQLIESLRERVLKGEDMSALAAQYSEDPGSAKKGGQLSPFGRGKMVPEFEEVAFSLKPGEISEVFETKYGYHFIQLLAREGESVVARHIVLLVK
ncbi:MAG: peptidyl-prolyl cis-trans isomerase [Sphingobacteriaceae bacterium]|nr:peptidyl-prolyl cis-trans isomerase [Sphingobacteriaceae bacterium]